MIILVSSICAQDVLSTFAVDSLQRDPRGSEKTGATQSGQRVHRNVMMRLEKVTELESTSKGR